MSSKDWRGREETGSSSIGKQILVRTMTRDSYRIANGAARAGDDLAGAGYGGRLQSSEEAGVVTSESRYDSSRFYFYVTKF